jgi:hypothetical protein
MGKDSFQIDFEDLGRELSFFGVPLSGTFYEILRRFY